MIKYDTCEKNLKVIFNVEKKLWSVKVERVKKPWQRGKVTLEACGSAKVKDIKVKF